MLTSILWSVALAQDSYTPGREISPPPAPPAAVAPVREPWREARRTLIGGGALVAAGAILGVTTFASATEDADVGTAVALESANVFGWTMAGSGLALVTVGVVHGLTTPTTPAPRRARLHVGPRAVGLSGRF